MPLAVLAQTFFSYGSPRFRLTAEPSLVILATAGFSSAGARTGLFLDGSRRADSMGLLAGATSSAIARIVSYALGALTSVVVARALGPEERGHWAVALLVAGIVALASELGLGNAIFFFVRQDRSRRAQVLTVALFLASAASLSAVALAGPAAAAGRLPFVGGVPNRVLVVALLAVPLTNWLGLTRQALVEEGRLIEVSVTQVFQAAAMIVLLSTGVLLLDLDAGRAVSLHVAALLATLVFAVWRAGRRRSLVPTWDPALVKPVLGYGLQSHLGMVALFLAYRFDLLLVNHFLGAKAAGLYSVSLSLSEALRGLPEIGQTIILSRSADDSAVLPVARMVILTTALAGVSCAVLSFKFVPLIFGDPFAASITPFAALVPGVVGLAVSYCISPRLVLAGRIRVAGAAAVVGLVVMIVVDLWLIPHLGIVGAALGSSLAYWVMAILQVHSVRALHPLPWRELTPGRTEWWGLVRLLRGRTTR